MTDQDIKKITIQLRRYLECHGISHDDSGDFVNDIYCRILKSGRVFTKKDMPYLYITAKNMMIDRWRHNSRDPLAMQTRDSTDIDEFLHANPESSPEYCYIENIAHRALCKSILKLTIRERQSFISHRMENHIIRDIAKEAKVSESAIEKLLARANKKIRKSLERDRVKASETGPVKTRESWQCNPPISHSN